MSNPRKEPTRIRPVRLPVSLDEALSKEAGILSLPLSTHIRMILAERQRGEQ